MKKAYLVVAALSAIMSANAQLDTVTFFNQVIQDIKTFDGKLFIGGNFTQNEGSTCYWSAYYNGSSVSTHTSLIGGGGVRQFEVFDNTLYNAGTMDFGGVLGVGEWTGSTWNDGGSINYSHSTIYADVNELYVESDNGLIRSKTAGGNWTTFYDFAGNGGIGGIVRYGSNLIFCGSFTDVNGVTASNIAQWDGSNWSPLGAGLDGSAGKMVVYNNELYVAGDFTLAGSTVVDGIAKWDGSAWSDVGGGLTGGSFASGINDMIVHNNLLYVVGRIDVIGGQTADDFAYWDGSNWTGINYPHPESTMRCIEVYNNEIYIGTFDFTKSRLYRYLGGVGIAENTLENAVSVSPNPSNGIFNLELDDYSKEINYTVVNSMGQQILTGNDSVIDLTNHESGIYYLQIISGESTKTIKLAKN